MEKITKKIKKDKDINKKIIQKRESSEVSN